MNSIDLECVDSQVTVHHCSRRAERHTEFRFEAGRRAIVNKESRSDRVDFNCDGFDLICRETLTAFHVQKRVERDVSCRT